MTQLFKVFLFSSAASCNLFVSVSLCCYEIYWQ